MCAYVAGRECHFPDAARTDGRERETEDTASRTGVLKGRTATPARPVLKEITSVRYMQDHDPIM